MRRSSPFLVLLLATAAGCGQVADNAASPPSSTETANATDTTAVDMAEIPPELPAPRGSAERATGPDIDPESAPGVAFDYRYSFRLAADRVAEMQQEHQRICARYGPRCRVTGMDYRAANAEDVEAMLSFVVDPAIAGQFGREGVRAVTAADGELTESEINGTDVGTSLKSNTGNIEDLQAELARIEARLERRGLRSRERERLDGERAEIRRQIAELRATTDGQERALATTPILFRYGSGALVPGPSREPTLGEATERAAGNFLSALKTLAIIFVTLSPWALLGLLFWGGFRIARRRFPAPPAAAADSEA